MPRANILPSWLWRHHEATWTQLRISAPASHQTHDGSIWCMRIRAHTVFCKAVRTNVLMFAFKDATRPDRTHSGSARFDSSSFIRRARPCGAVAHMPRRPQLLREQRFDCSIWGFMVNSESQHHCPIAIRRASPRLPSKAAWGSDILSASPKSAAASGAPSSTSRGASPLLVSAPSCAA